MPVRATEEVGRTGPFSFQNQLAAKHPHAANLFTTRVFTCKAATRGSSNLPKRAIPAPPAYHGYIPLPGSNGNRTIISGIIPCSPPLPVNIHTYSGDEVSALRPLLDQALQLHQDGKLTDAESLYNRILQQWPGQPDAMNLLGVLANQVGRPEVALDLIGKALARLPNEPDFHGNMAAALQAVGRVTDSIRHYREAIRLKPGAVTYHVLLSEGLQQQGNFDEALKVGLEALRLDPFSAQAYCILGDLAAHNYYTLTDFDVRRMEQLLEEGRQTPADTSLLHFTLAAHFERTASFDQSFAHYVRANEFKKLVYLKDNRAFDQGRHKALIDGLIAEFTPPYFAATRSLGVDNDVPILVVGLVRSGTTLVEQILASHPRVFGAGERKEIDQISTRMHEQIPGALPYPACIRQLEAGLARHQAYGYLQTLAREAGTADRIVDKMPHNYLHLGMIATLFPKAHIIHCRRDPMDVCASAFFQNFKWMPHASSIEDIAFYYRHYVRLMEHWRRVLPLPIHEVVYEAMVADPEGESRKLVAACGLDWDDSCLTFYRTKRTVQTASKLQVRQPIYRKAVNRWKPYEKHLEPLRQALELPPE